MTLAYAYGQLGKSLMNKEIDYDSDDIKVMLVTSAYTFNKDTHQYKSSITNEVAATGGYTAGGLSLGTKTVGYDTATDTTNADAADTVWANSTITARGAIIYDNTPATDATKPLLIYIDFEADQTSVGANFTLIWHALGIFGIAA